MDSVDAERSNAQLGGGKVLRISRDAAAALQVAPWDAIAPIRAKDLDAGSDLSFDHVIAPTILKWAQRSNGPVLDVGCGTGRLTRRLAVDGRRVVAIDPSEVSATIARHHCRDRNVAVYAQGIEEFATASSETFDVVVLSMVLQDVVNLENVLGSAASMLRQSGALFIAVTHPYFWPKYWGYSRAKWFDYRRELFLKTEFRTSLTRSGVQTMHAHRPLESYIQAMASAGLTLTDLREPDLPASIQRVNGVHWTEPHFLFLAGRARPS